MACIVHLSDIHVGQPCFRLRYLTPRRGLGMVNYLVRRRFQFLPELLRSAVRWIVGERPDVLVVSGDLSTVALPGEFELALDLLRPAIEASGRFMVIPGNHDHYGPDAEAVFERVFASWLPSPYPQVVELPEGVFLVALDVAHPYRLLPGEARCPQDQLDALGVLLASPDRAGRPWALVCHYPVCLPGGARDTMGHRLRNAADLSAVIGHRPPRLYLHGHIHEAWLADWARLPGTLLVNAGSVTFERAPSFAVHELREDGSGVSRIFRPDGDGGWRPAEARELPGLEPKG